VEVREEMWKLQYGAYRCGKCGETMLSLVNDFEEIPLYCPYCLRPKQKTLFTYVRHFAIGEEVFEELQKYLL
jgi:DNA-directed RNA polymerase subunit RPC12/RpoP